MIVSFPTLSVCSRLFPPLQPVLGKMTGKRLCLLLDRSAMKCFRVKIKERREKVVYKRTSVKVPLSVLRIPLLTPLLPVSLSFISLLFFLTPSVSLSLSLPLLLAILFLLPLASVCCRHRFLPPSPEI